jgi:hypothetical protein
VAGPGEAADANTGLGAGWGIAVAREKLSWVSDDRARRQRGAAAGRGRGERTLCAADKRDKLRKSTRYIAVEAAVHERIQSGQRQ